MTPSPTRREALAALAGLFLAACSGGSSSSSKSSSSSASSSASSSVASTSSGSVASSGAAGGTGSTAGATTGGDVVGSGNAAITREILESDAAGYNGAWAGAWSVPGFGTRGTITATATIDPAARVLTVDIAVQGDLFHDGQPTAPFTVSGSVDSFTYAEDGTFSIQQPTPAGNASMASGAGIGSGEFNLRVTEIPGHPAVHNFEAKGVANRANQIPTTFTVTYRDGSSADGIIDFRH